MEERLEAPAQESEQSTFVKRLVTALAWGTIALAFGIYFAQFRTVLWEAWDPPFFSYIVAHIAVAGLVTTVWFLDRQASLARWAMGLVLFAAFIAAGYYLFSSSSEMIHRASYGTKLDLAFGVTLFAAVIYLSWSYWGAIFPVLCFFFIGYLFIADLLPGPLKGPSFEVHRILTRITHQMFSGVPDIGARFLWLLILWGMLMNTSGAGLAILGLAKILSKTGIAGGPAIGAMLASAITGSFVGGGTSNVAITGPVTIPAMRRAGYTAEQAASVEAMASNASSITPPVLGTVAFVMAEVTGMSYIEIIVMSLVPALLWFLASGVYIFAHAMRNQDAIRAVHFREAGDESIPWHRYLRSALLLVTPVGVILWLILQGYSLRMGTVGAFFTTLALGTVLRVETRWFVWTQGVRQAAYYASSVSLILVVVALMADSISWTGLGGRLGNIVESVSQGQVLIAGVILIIFGVILGSGLPALAIYFIVAVTFAPVLSRMGVDFRASHYISFYIGTLGAIIPPVAASALVAAAVAQTKYWPVCKVLARMSWPLWIFPLLFLAAPELLLLGDASPAMRMLIIVTTAVGIIGVQTSTAGWLIHPLVPPVRAVLYANFVLLVISLRQDSVILMILSILIVAASAAVTLALHGREVAQVVPAKSEAGGQ